MTTQTNNYTPYTIKGSGVSLFIKPLAPMLFKQIARAFPEPEPPRERIERIDGSWYEEDNKHHPDYLAALERREEKINGMISDLCVELAAMIILTPEQVAETQSYRASVARITGEPLPDEPIETAYLKYIALADVIDLRDFIRAVMSRIRPDEKKLQSGSNISEPLTTESQSGGDPQDGAVLNTPTS